MKKVTFSSLKALPKLNSPMTLMHKTPNLNKIRSISSVYNPNLALINTSSCKTSRKNTKLKKTLEMIHKLSLESNIRDIYMEERKLEKKREKINDNQEIRERRLGLIKEKESDSEEDKEKQTCIQSIINEMSMEKIGTKEKEKKVEKLYHRSIKDLQIIENHIINKTKEIIELSDKIENDKLEINVIDQYGENIDRKQINSEIPTRVEERKITLRMNKSKNKKQGHKRMSVVLKIDDIEKESKIMIKKYQRNERQKQMKSKVELDMEQLDKLQKENDILKEKSANLKKLIIDLKKELINIYHSQLYEGLEFKGPGLVSLILNIWNLGVNIDKNFMPTYLDKISVDFLFKKARQIIEKNKLKKQLEEAEMDFIKTLKKWKEDEILSNEKNNIDNFFKTNISEDESFYDQYPKTRLFMKTYRKKHVKETDKVEDIKVNNNIFFKSRNIPGLIMEKNKKVEKAKYLLQNQRNQMEKDEKNEVLRLSKEFLFNNYGKIYEVCIETVIGALCGEDHKDAQLNYYNKIKKDYKDDLKKIEFFKKLPKNALTKKSE